MKRTNEKRRLVSAHRDPVDEHAATELVMYIENTSDLSLDGPRGQGRSILLNALRKWKKGTYDSAKAVKLFEYLTEAGARRYAKEFDSEKNWSKMFTPATRHEAAKQLEASFRNSVEHGEYDHVDTRIARHPGEARQPPPSEARRRKRPPERPAAHASRERKYSMTYGEMPPFEQFKRDIHTRIDPEGDGKKPYWPPGTTYPMELVGAHEQELAYNYGLEPFQSERQRTGRNSRAQGFRGDESDIYNFVVFLIEEWNNGDEEAGDLASSIMYTLGYEWI